MFVCPAEDTYNGRRLNIRKLCTLESHRGQKKGGRQRGGKDLPHKVELALGMKVMVTDNVETDLDITNGARGKIVGITLHPDEPPVDKNEAIVKLHYLPVYIYPCQTFTRKGNTTGKVGGGGCADRTNFYKL